jgi:hypothetical protein
MYIRNTYSEYAIAFSNILFRTGKLFCLFLEQFARTLHLSISTSIIHTYTCIMILCELLQYYATTYSFLVHCTWTVYLVPGTGDGWQFVFVLEYRHTYNEFTGLVVLNTTGSTRYYSTTIILGFHARYSTTTYGALHLQ